MKFKLENIIKHLDENLSLKPHEKKPTKKNQINDYMINKKYTTGNHRIFLKTNVNQ